MCVIKEYIYCASFIFCNKEIDIFYIQINILFGRSLFQIYHLLTYFACSEQHKNTINYFINALKSV